MIPRKIVDSIRETGTAQASEGGIANTGQIGTLIVDGSTGAPVRSSYQEKVRLIAPAELLERDNEIALLNAFCATQDDSTPYLWFRAPAWAGKSALMSWFVLHPPEGTRVVSFFITARYAGQSDRIAFAEVLIEQLADLLDEPLPPLLTEATREAHLLRMLSQGASTCHRNGERLILIVDGLDEDSGVTTGADAHSVAALLPAIPVGGMRVVVAGRPNPPIPSDVPDGHPLRDPGIVRILSESPHAAVVRQDAERELRRLLRGSAPEQDLLGFLTAAGGGLSEADLSELTGLSLGDVRDELAAVSARTFAPRSGRWQPATTVYVLGHEELQQQAMERLGRARLHDFRQRLHTWADEYCERCWPCGTPEYLLRGYFRLLQTVSDLPRMLSLATDSNRHRRMLDITGGDYVALSEISTTGEEILTSEQPDLSAMVGLSTRRYGLMLRNNNIPVRLPAVWASLGRPSRAEALAHSLTDRHERTQALAGVAVATAKGADFTMARKFANDAEASALALNAHYEEIEALEAVAMAWVAIGDFPAAEATARSVADPDDEVAMLAAVVETAATIDLGYAQRLMRNVETRTRPLANPHTESWVLARIAAAVAATGEFSRAEDLIDAISNPYQQAAALGRIAEIAASGGHFTDARRLAEEGESMALRLLHPNGEPPLLGIVKAWIAADDHRRAERLALSLNDAYAQAEALAGIAEALAAKGDATHAETIASSIADAYWRAQALTDVASAAAATGSPERAQSIAEYAESLARAIADPDEHVRMLAAITEAATSAGAMESARTLARQAQGLVQSVEQLHLQAEALAEAARALAMAGDTADAETLADLITDPSSHAQALCGIALVITHTDLQYARNLVERAADIAFSITDHHRRERASSELIRSLAAVGEIERAETLLLSLSYEIDRAQVLGEIAPALLSAGKSTQVESLARSITDPEWKAATLANVAVAEALSGDRARALLLSTDAIKLAGSLTDSTEQAEVIAIAVRAIARAGDIDRAENIARSIRRPDAQASALAAVAVTASPSRAKQLTAEALHIGPLERGLSALAEVQPDAIITLAALFGETIEEANSMRNRNPAFDEG